MSETDVNKMDFKQLRNEVQLLRDELALFKRKYEDIIYNLDSDNFSGKFLAEQDNMKAKVEIAADSIAFMVSSSDLKKALEKYATLKITDDKIASTVTEVNTETDGKIASRIEQTASEIYAEVGDVYGALDDVKSSISVTAEGISLVSENLDSFKSSTFTQTADGGFALDGEKVKVTGHIIFTDNAGVERFSISHDESQDYGAFVMLHPMTDQDEPIVIGDTDGNVYIASLASGNEVATRGWVKKNAGGGGSGVATFG